MSCHHVTDYQPFFYVLYKFCYFMFYYDLFVLFNTIFNKKITNKLSLHYNVFTCFCKLRSSF